MGLAVELGNYWTRSVAYLCGRSWAMPKDYAAKYRTGSPG